MPESASFIAGQKSKGKPGDFCPASLLIFWHVTHTRET
jgi:hypothetical protein